MLIRCAILATLVCTTNCLAEQSKLSIAYVVFGGQIVAVDTTASKVIKRRDTVSHLRPAITASLVDEGRAIVMAGSIYSDEKNSGLIKIGLPDMKLEAKCGIQRGRTLPFFQCHDQRHVENDKVIVLSSLDDTDDGDRVMPEYIETIDARTLKRIGKATIDPDKESSPYQRSTHFALTRDDKQLLVATSSGYKWQCFLRIYSFPTLKLQKSVPLLEICDDTPIGLLVP